MCEHDILLHAQQSITIILTAIVMAIFVSFTFTFTFSHLADAFIQSDLQLGST